MTKKKSGGRRKGAGRPKKTSETTKVVFTFDRSQWAALCAAFGRKGAHAYCHKAIDISLLNL